MSALRSPFGPRRSTDDFRPLQAHFRKRSSAEQSLMSFRIGSNSNDDDLVEEEEEEADFEERRIDEESKADVDESGVSADVAEADPGETEDLMAGEATSAATGSTAAGLGAPETDKKRAASLRRNHTDDSEVERRVAKLLYEINYSATDSVDESKIQSRCSIVDTTTTTTSTSTTNGAHRAEVETLRADFEGRDSEGGNIEGRDSQGRDVEGKDIEGRDIEGRDIEGRDNESRDIEG